MLVVCANACTIKMHENVSFLLRGCEIRITFAVEKNNKDKAQKVNKDDLFIRVDYNKDKRTITICDNGTGMTEEE